MSSLLWIASIVSNPLIDVVIPVFNGAKTIKSAVASIQAQTVRDIRILVINDGSTDETPAIVRRLAAADERILLIDQPNGGIVDALNTGLATCNADIIARHDGDDLAHPERFDTQLRWLRSNPACNAVAGSFMLMDQAGRALGPPTEATSPDLADPLFYPQKEPYLVHPFLMMRRAAAAAVGGYRYVFHAEDVDLYWRLQEIGTLTNLPDVLGSYRIHDQSVTGISTLNGRISALSSQLAGISAMRRRSGRPDITFPKSALVEYTKGRTLEKIVELGSRGLDSGETLRLAAATSAKLLDLAAYRPYELEPEDCSFIRTSIMRALPSMTQVNRAMCVRMLTGTAARLAVQGHIAASVRLSPARFYPLVAARYALRRTLPRSVRGAMRKVAGRPSLVK